MANTKKSEPAKKQNFFVRVGLWFVNAPKRLVKSFKNMVRELKKVSWPTRKELLNYTLVVLLFMVFMGVVIGLLDMGASKFITEIAAI